MHIVGTCRWILLLLAFFWMVSPGKAQNRTVGFPGVAATGYLPSVGQQSSFSIEQDEATIRYYGEYDAVEDLNADVPALLLRFESPLTGEVADASFFIYNGILQNGTRASGISGTGTLRLLLFEAPDPDMAPAITDPGIAMYDVDFADLTAVPEQPTDLPNDIDLRGQGFEVTADQSYYLMFLLVDASPDAALTFVIDEGSVDATNGNYYPARTLTYRRGEAIPPGGAEGYYRYQGSNANVVVELTVEGTTGGLLVAPQLRAPTEGSVDVETVPTFSWTRINAAVEYQIQIASNMEFTMPEFDDTVGDTTYSGATLQPMTAYFWRVRAIDASGNNGPFSAAARFTTALVTALEAQDGRVPGGVVLAQNYPNPFSESTTFNFALPAPETVRLSVYDVLGKEIALLVDDRLAPGHYSFTWQVEARAAGVYLYRLQVGSQVEVRHMMVIR